MKIVVTGNESAAWGARVAGAEVISAYPITPQTTIVEKIADFVAKGELDAEFVKVESEHSAMAACISAANTGVRTFTATSSQGLLLMHELLHWASSARLPVVMVNVNRATGPPWSIWTDHTDSLAQRDTGWMQIYCESNQEVLDSILQAYKVSEQHDVLLPTLLTEDAFYLSHTSEIVDVPEPDVVKEYLPKLEMPFKLDVDDPHGFGSLSMPHQWFPELKYNIAAAMDTCLDKIEEADREFKKLTGRSTGGLIEEYRCDGADVVFLCSGTMASTAKDVVDALRDRGQKVGLARLRVFRPFPVEKVRDLAGRVKMLGVLDRSFCFGYQGALGTEVQGALFNSSARPVLKNYIVGWGGRDVTLKVLEGMFENAFNVLDNGLDREVEWVNLKGEGKVPAWGVK